MPTYEYRCDACKHTFEIEQRITEAKLEKCPSCKKKKLVRLVGAGNFILKGGGWYKDLYSSAPKKSGGARDDKGGDASGEKGEKSDAKSDAKSDTKSEKKSDAKSDKKSEKSEKSEKKAKAD